MPLGACGTRFTFEQTKTDQTGLIDDLSKISRMLSQCGHIQHHHSMSPIEQSPLNLIRQLRPLFATKPHRHRSLTEPGSALLCR